MSGGANGRPRARVELVWVAEEMRNVGGSEYMTALFTSLLEEAGLHVRLVAPAGALRAWTGRAERSGAEIIFANGGGCQSTSLCEAARRVCRERPPAAVQFTPVGKACGLWCADAFPGVPVIAWEPTGMSPACNWMPPDLEEILRRLDGLIVLTESAAGEAHRRFGYQGRLAVVPNTIAAPPAELSPRTGSPPVVTCVSRLAPEKGVDLAIHSFALFQRSNPGAELHLWGHGEDEERLRELAVMLQLERSVKFRGVFEPFDEIDRVAAGTNIAILSSFFEGMPVALMEMAARGVPIVASRTSGAEAVLGANYPWLSPVGDTAAMARHLEILACSNGAWHETHRRLLAEWPARFCPHKSVARLTEFYASVLGPLPC